MATTTEIEARLREYARLYDQEFPSTVRAESRTMARIAITPRPLTRMAEPRRKWALAGVLVRSLAITCLVLIAVGALAIGVTRLRAVQRHNVPTIGAPGKLDVYFTGMEFISADQGWIAETRSSLSLAGPTVLFRTTDGGHSWQSQLTWDGPGPAQIRFSPDGVQGMVVGRGGVPLFTTSDGGTHWQRQQTPSQLTSADLIYFLDAREGWIIGYLNEATAGFAGVFHTTDGGQHWTQTARLDVGQVFSYGQRGGSLQGALIFHDSSTGWLTPPTISGTDVPVVEPHLYVTHDGGTSWSVQKLASPAGAGLDSTNSGVSLPQFFSPMQGILVVTKISPPPTGVGQPGPTIQGTYVYTTTDGGFRWTNPRLITLPSGFEGFGTLIAVDAANWMILSNGGVARTTDGGGHWAPIAGWPPANERVVAVGFQNASIAWAEVVVTAAHPTLAIYRTTDGGSHWSRLTVPAVS
jgi:photosystem II stability/assembly factor-like uncharacterized protein